jgi:hypothetical protein
VGFVLKAVSKPNKMPPAPVSDSSAGAAQAAATG